MPFGDIPQDMFDRFKAVPVLDSLHVEEALTLVLGKKSVTKKNAGCKVIVLGLDKDSKKAASANAAATSECAECHKSSPAKGSGQGGADVKTEKSAPGKEKSKGNGKGGKGKSEPKLELKIAPDTKALPLLTQILARFLKEKSGGSKPHYFNRVVIRAGAKHGPSNMDIGNLSGLLPELWWAGGQETVPPGAPWWSDGESVGLAISEVKLRHEVRSMDPRIAGCFAFTKSDTAVACDVNFPFYIQASAFGAEDLRRMGTA
ncbi:unnamed protein product, partial [Symbiodinium pilosum]